MSKHTLRVVVIGGGIMGASVAWNLAREGAQVTLLERQNQPAQGATGWSYGWIGTSSSLPSEHPARFALKIQAMDAYKQLEQHLSTLPIAARGAIVWLPSETETSELITQQRHAGIRIEPLTSSQIAKLEPGLAAPPTLAAWAPDDFSVEPADLTRMLMDGARDAGAEIVCQANIGAIETQGSRVTAVRDGARTFPADVVVLANAASARPLAATLGISLPVHEEPAVLMRLATESRLVSHLLYGQDVELRPTLCGDLLSAMDCPADPVNGLAAAANQAIVTIRSMFTSSPEIALRTVTASPRPMTLDGLPLRKFLPEVEGLYALIAHPGMILAPLLGHQASSEILSYAN